jgi:hypothetical protein
MLGDRATLQRRSAENKNEARRLVVFQQRDD